MLVPREQQQQQQESFPIQHTFFTRSLLASAAELNLIAAPACPACCLASYSFHCAPRHRHDLQLEFLEAVFGVSREINVERLAGCGVSWANLHLTTRRRRNVWFPSLGAHVSGVIISVAVNQDAAPGLTFCC